MNPEIFNLLAGLMPSFGFGTSQQLAPMMSGLREFMDQEQAQKASQLNVDPLRDIAAYRVNPHRGFLAQDGGEVESGELLPLPFQFLMPTAGLSLTPNPLGSIRNSIQVQSMDSFLSGGAAGQLPSLPAAYQLDTINNVPSNLPGGAPGKYDLSQLAIQQNQTPMSMDQAMRDPIFGNKMFDRDIRFQTPLFKEGGYVEIETFILDDSDEARAIFSETQHYQYGGEVGTDMVYVPVQYSNGGPVHIYGVDKAIFGKIVKGIKKVAKGIGKGVAKVGKGIGKGVVAVGKGIKDAALFSADGFTNLALGMDLIKPGAYSYGFSKKASNVAGAALSKIGDIAVPIAASFIGSPALGAAISGARGMTSALGDGKSFGDAFKSGLLNAGATLVAGNVLKGAGVEGFGDIGKLFKGPGAVGNVQKIFGAMQGLGSSGGTQAAAAAAAQGSGFNAAPFLGLAGAGAIGAFGSNIGSSQPTQSSGSLFNRIARDVKAEEIGQSQQQPIQEQPQSFALTSGTHDYNDLPPDMQSKLSNLMTDVYNRGQSLGMFNNSPQKFFFGGLLNRAAQMPPGAQMQGIGKKGLLSKTGSIQFNPSFNGDPSQLPQLPGMFGRMVGKAAAMQNTGPGLLGRPMNFAQMVAQQAQQAAPQMPQGAPQLTPQIGGLSNLMNIAQSAAQQAQQAGSQVPAQPGGLAGLFSNLRGGLDQIRNSQGDMAQIEQARAQMMPQLQSLFGRMPILGGGLGMNPMFQGLQMARPAQFGFKEGGEVEGINLIPIQTEKVNGKPEMIVHLDGAITKVNATKSHKQMDKEEVTDIVPEGSYILSADKTMKMSYKDADEVVMGIKAQPYKEWKQGKVPTEITLANLWGTSRKSLTPAELGMKIKQKYNTVDKDRYYEWGEDVFTKRTNQENIRSRLPYLAEVVGFNESKRGNKPQVVSSFKHGGPAKYKWTKHAQFGLQDWLGVAGTALPFVTSLFGGGGGQSGGQGGGQYGVSPLVQSGLLGTIPAYQAGLTQNVNAMRDFYNQATNDIAGLTQQGLADERNILRQQLGATGAGVGLNIASLLGQDLRQERRDTGAEQSMLRNYMPRSASRAAMEAAATPSFDSQALAALGPRAATMIAQAESDRVRNANQLAHQRNQYLDNFELQRMGRLNELTLGDQMFNLGAKQGERDLRNQRLTGITGTLGQGIQRGADLQTENLRRMLGLQSQGLTAMQQMAGQAANQAGRSLMGGAENAFNAFTTLGGLQGQMAALNAQAGGGQQAQAAPTSNQQLSNMLGMVMDTTPNAATTSQQIDPNTIQPANPGMTFQPADPSQPLGGGFNVNPSLPSDCGPNQIYIPGMGCV